MRVVLAHALAVIVIYEYRTYNIKTTEANTGPVGQDLCFFKIHDSKIDYFQITLYFNK